MTTEQIQSGNRNVTWAEGNGTESETIGPLKLALEEFLLQNEDLERLESLLAEFNAFETLDIVRAEIKHSNVLAWLLNPNANHGLKDQFLRLFLKYLFSNNRDVINSEVTFFDIEVFILDDIEVRREWNSIDLLLISDANKFVVVLENKVTTTEHDDQLNRYFQVASKEFADYRKLYVYLTPGSLTPSDEQNWIIFDYQTIYAILRNLLKTRKTSISENVYEFLNQYCTALRRYILPNSEIEEICKKIYAKHQQALDLIFQYKPDIELEVSEIFQDAIKSHDNLILDSAGKTLIRFTSRELDSLIPNKGQGWLTSKRMLVFEFNNSNKRGVLRLYIGPGDSNIRNKLHEIAKKDTKLFNISDRKLGAKFLAIYQKDYLKKKDYEESDAVELTEIINKKFSAFINDDLPHIEKHIRDNWIK